MISCVLKIPNVSSEIIVSFIYAVNCKDGRLQLWEDLKHLGRDQFVSVKPWATLGDFNQIIYPAKNSREYKNLKRDG